MGKSVKVLNKGAGKNRFVFQSFTQRLAGINVNVYRRLGETNATPTGADSFFHQELLLWQELNLAADFNSLVSEVTRYVQTLPQLLHHKDKVAQALLTRLKLTAILSLEPVLALIAALARDLRDEFLPYVPSVLGAYGRLLEEGGERETELVEQLFASTCYLFKFLRKSLCLQIPLVLRCTYGLRVLHKRPEIRRFACEAVAFLLRTAPPEYFELGVAHVVAEIYDGPPQENEPAAAGAMETFGRRSSNNSVGHVAVERDPGDVEAKADGSAMLLGETFRGPSGSLHSRFCLGLDLLIKGVQQEVQTTSTDNIAVGHGGGGAPYMQQYGGYQLVLPRFVQYITEFLRREHSGTFWASLTSHASASLSDISEKAKQPDAATHWISARLVLSCLVFSAIHERGSLVKDWIVVIDFVEESLLPLFGPDGPALDESLEAAAVDLISEIVRFHAKVDGGQRWSSIWDSVRLWGPTLLSKSALSPGSTVRFCSRILEVGSLPLQGWGSHLLKRLVKLVASAAKDCRGPSWRDARFHVEALLLVERFFQVNCSSASSQIQGQDAIALTKATIEKVDTWLADAAKPGTAVIPDTAHIRLARAWAGLRVLALVLEAASERSASARKVAATTYKFTGHIIQVLTELLLSHKTKDMGVPASCVLGTVFGVRGRAVIITSLCAGCTAGNRDAEQASTLVRDTCHEYVDLIRRRPCCHATLSACASFFQLLREHDPELATSVLSAEELLGIMPLLEPNLRHSSNLLRLASLRVLCQYVQLDLCEGKADRPESGRPPQPEKCSLFQNFLRVAEAPLDLQHSRSSSNAVSSTVQLINSSRVPEAYLASLASLCVGLFHVKFKLLWEAACEVLVALLAKHDRTLWPRIFQALVDAQEQFLAERWQRPRTAAVGRAPHNDVHCHGGEDESFNGSVDDTEVPTDDEARLLDKFQESCTPKDGTTALARMQELLRVLEAAPRAVEKHLKEFVPAMLEYIWEPAADLAGHPLDDVPRKMRRVRSGKTWRIGLQSYLRLAQALKGLNGFYQRDELRDALETLLIDLDPQVQHLSLACLQRLKLGFLAPYHENLERLIAPVSLRDELTVFTLADSKDEGATILPQHRSAILQYVIRVLFPKMRRGGAPKGGQAVQRKGANGKDVNVSGGSGRAARSAVLIAFTRLQPQELRPLLGLILRPLADALPGDRAPDGLLPDHDVDSWIGKLFAAPSDYFCGIDLEKLRKVKAKRRVGCLHLLQDVADFLGRSLEPYLNTLMGLLLSCYQASCRQQLPGEASDTEAHAPNDTAESKVGRETRALVIKIMVSLLERHPCYDVEAIWPAFVAAVSPGLKKVPYDAVSNNTVPPLLTLASVLSSHLKLLPYFDPFMDAVVRCLSVRVMPKGNGNTGEVVMLSSKGKLSQLTAVEVLLSIFDVCDENGDHQVVSGAMMLVRQHLGTILESLSNVISAELGPHKGAKAANSRVGGESKELALLQRVIPLINDRRTATAMIKALLPLVATGVRSSKRRKLVIKPSLDVLCSVAELSPSTLPTSLNGLPTRQFVTEAIAHLFSEAPEPPLRLEAARVLTKLAKLDSDQTDNEASTIMGQCLIDLNSMSAEAVDEIDYQRRVNAYESLNERFFLKLRAFEVLPLAHQACFDVESTEIGIRSAGAHTALLLVRAAKMATCDLELADESVSEGGAIPNHVAAVGLIDLVKSVVVASIRSSLRSGSASARHEFTMLLGEVVSELPSLFPDLQILLSDDVEVNFFQNIIHIQHHRRLRAMQRFRRLCEQGTDDNPTQSAKFRESSLTGLLAPLFLNCVLDGTRDKEGNMVEEAIKALSKLGSLLKWSRYQQLVVRVIALIDQEPTRVRPLLRLLVGLLREYPFHVVRDQDKLKATSSDSLIAEAVASPTDRVNSFIGSYVTPTLAKHMMEKQEVVNVSVVGALANALKLLPPGSMQRELPRTLQGVTNLLASRQQHVRDGARKALVELCAVVGLEYLPSVVDVLQTALAKGFQVHILGYTVHSILERCLTDSITSSSDRRKQNIRSSIATSSGELVDRCVGSLVPLLEADIFGSVSDERQVEAISSKMKEAQSCKSFESLLLLARSITFDAQGEPVGMLLDVIRTRLRLAHSPKIRSKLKEVLQKLARGFQANATATATQLLVLSFTLIDDYLISYAQQKEADGAEAQRLLKQQDTKPGHRGNPDKDAQKEDEEKATQNQYILAEFGLQLLLAQLKNPRKVGALVADDDVEIDDQSDRRAGSADEGRHEEDAHRDIGVDFIDLLSPFFPLLSNCLDAHSSEVCGLSLKCLGRMARLPLTTLEAEVATTARKAFGVLRRSGNLSLPLPQDCLKLIIALIRQCKHYQPTDGQVNFLLDNAFSDLEDLQARATTFALLRSVISLRVVKPQVYDIMDRVQTLMVNSQSAPVRDLCCQTISFFLLNYPLGARRLKRHLEFVVANLEYEHPTGRQAVLDLLQMVIARFPTTVVQEFAEFFFVPLVSALANDPDASVRAQIATVLKTLLVQAESKQDALLKFASAWLQGEDTQLKAAALQIYGLALEIKARSLKRDMPRVLSELRSSLAGSVDDEGSWERVYMCLCFVEKLSKEWAPALNAAVPDEGWDVVTIACRPHFLTFPHMWVRKVASRILSVWLGTCEALPASNVRDGPGVTELKGVASSCCRAVETLAKMDESYELSMTRNLVLTGCLIYKAEKGAREDSMLEVDAVFSGGLDESHEMRADASTLGWLFRRMSALSLRGEEMQQRVAINWLGQIMEGMERDTLKQHVGHMLKPLQRLASPGYRASSDLKVLGETIVMQVRDSIGSNDFVQAITRVDEHRRQTKESRKRKLAMQTMVDPQAAARRKQAKGLKKQAQKRKATELRRAHKGGGLKASPGVLTSQLD